MVSSVGVSEVGLLCPDPSQTGTSLPICFGSDVGSGGSSFAVCDGSGAMSATGLRSDALASAGRG